MAGIRGWGKCDHLQEHADRNWRCRAQRAAAASSPYRLGQMEDVHTFDKAMELAQGMSGLAVNTDYVLAQDGGRKRWLAWLQGHGELEAERCSAQALAEG